MVILCIHLCFQLLRSFVHSFIQSVHLLLSTIPSPICKPSNPILSLALPSLYKSYTLRLPAPQSQHIYGESRAKRRLMRLKDAWRVVIYSPNPSMSRIHMLLPCVRGFWEGRWGIKTPRTHICLLTAKTILQHVNICLLAAVVRHLMYVYICSVVD